MSWFCMGFTWNLLLYTYALYIYDLTWVDPKKTYSGINIILYTESQWDIYSTKEREVTEVLNASSSQVELGSASQAV